MKSIDKEIIQCAKNLRNNMTKEEKHLWYDYLKKHPIRFQRQKIYGRYILDFYSYKARLVIELDGSQHYKEKAIEYDKKRTEFLEENQLKVIRFTNLQINQNFSGVCSVIDKIVTERVSQFEKTKNNR